MTIRGVNQQRIDPPWLGQTWTWRQVDKLGEDTLPKNQYNWPNPTVSTWIDETITWRQVGFLGKDKLPNRQQDWPNPNSVLWSNSWSINLLQTTLKPSVLSIPKNQYDWPNPPSVVWYQTQATSATYLLGQGFPTNQLDWPNPKSVTWYQDWNNQLVLNMPVFAPSVASYWDIPQSVTWYQDWSQNLLLTTLAAIPAKIPFLQFDWPNPQSVLWSQPWSSRYNLYGQDKLPNRQQDWPSPQSIQWYQDYRLNLLQSTLIPPPAVLPHNQYDWPLNYQPVSLTQSWTYTSQFIVPVPVIPTFITGGRQLGPGPESRYQTELRQLITQRQALEAAQALAKRGGEARAKSLTASQRTNIASHAASIRWKK
jgi:hypothetical protein